jgi:hypothetical protein
VTPVQNDDGSVAYQASSPDEVAIVKWTEAMGITLVARDRKRISQSSRKYTGASREMALTLWQTASACTASLTREDISRLPRPFAELIPAEKEPWALPLSYGWDAMDEIARQIGIAFSDGLTGG